MRIGEGRRRKGGRSSRGGMWEGAWGEGEGLEEEWSEWGVGKKDKEIKEEEERKVSGLWRDDEKEIMKEWSEEGVESEVRREWRVKWGGSGEWSEEGVESEVRRECWVKWGGSGEWSEEGVLSEVRRECWVKWGGRGEWSEEGVESEVRREWRVREWWKREEERCKV